MTQKGAQELYMWLMAAWPLVIKSNASEAFQKAKMQELYRTYQEYTDEEVRAAFDKWTDENEKFPTTKNIINEIRWARARKGGKKVDPTKLYMMERIADDGTEYAVMHNGKIMFTWDEFVNLPSNKDHLDPEEWERRYRARRKTTLDRVYAERRAE